MFPDFPRRTVPTVDEVLDWYFGMATDGLTGRRLRRMEAVGENLRRCFEEHADQLLTSEEERMLLLEQQFGVEGAAARVAAPDALLVVVPTFLVESRWHGDPVDRRLRHREAWRLAHWTARLPELARTDLGAVLQAVRDAELVSRRAERRDRAEEGRRRMNDRERELLDQMFAKISLRARPVDPEVAPIAALRRPFPLLDQPQR